LQIPMSEGILIAFCSYFLKNILTANEKTTPWM
jgi:hypothetical protein